MNYKSRRVFACIIDLILVIFITSMMASIPMCNPYLENYEKYSDKYTKEIDGMLSDIESGYDVKLTISNEMKDLSYKVDKSSFFIYLWYIVFFYLYFGVFQFFTGGQTLGKKIFGLKVVSNDNSNVSITQLINRNLLLGNSLSNGVVVFVLIKMILLLTNLNVQTYFYVSTGLSLITFIYEAVFIIYYLLNKEGKGLNDLLGRTKVIDLRV